jgi:hypothetical protein
VGRVSRRGALIGWVVDAGLQHRSFLAKRGTSDAETGSSLRWDSAPQSRTSRLDARIRTDSDDRHLIQRIPSGTDDLGSRARVQRFRPFGL